MSGPSEDDIFNAQMCARLREIRESMPGKWTAERMATMLGIPAERYRKYEVRSPLPHYLIPRLSAISGCDIAYILTGKNERRLLYTETKKEQRA